MDRPTESYRRRPLAFLCPRRGAAGPSSQWRRAGSVAAAVPMILVGTLLIVTPAPGLVLIGGGLAILSREFRAARRLGVALQWRLRQLRRARAAASAASS